MAIITRISATYEVNSRIHLPWEFQRTYLLLNRIMMHWPWSIWSMHPTCTYSMDKRSNITQNIGFEVIIKRK